MNDENQKIERVSVVGLGKLGAPFLACIASKGYPVIGIDVVPVMVEKVNRHEEPVQEPQLQEMLTAYRANISATMDWAKLVLGSDISFIVVPTPSGADGSFSNQHVIAACEEVGKVLRNKSDFHVVTVISTMMPGSSDKVIIPALERSSGKKAGEGFGYIYSPTLIALGSVIKDFLNPDLMMIGEADPRSGKMLEAFYRTVFESNPSYHHVKPVEVELAKIAINTYVTTKISFANMLGHLSEQLGAKVDNVTKIVGSDSRIGAKYLKAGTSYGGPCFPRDNRALIRVAMNVGVNAYIPQATDATNREQIELMAQRIKTMLNGSPSQKVGVIGTAYKNDTDVIEEAAGLHLVNSLLGTGVRVVVHDPMALASAQKVWGERVEYAPTLAHLFQSADLAVVTNPYQDLASRLTKEMVSGKTILDYWRVLRGSEVDGVAKIISFGATSQEKQQQG